VKAILVLFLCACSLSSAKVRDTANTRTSEPIGEAEPVQELPSLFTTGEEGHPVWEVAGAGAISHKNTVIWPAWSKAYKECIKKLGWKDCEPIIAGTYRDDKSSCHGVKGSAIDIYGIKCGKKKYMAIDHTLDKFVKCADPKFKTTLYWENPVKAKTEDQQNTLHQNHAHFSNCCTLKSGKPRC
jgi:hypothetical protein